MTSEATNHKARNFAFVMKHKDVRCTESRPDAWIHNVQPLSVTDRRVASDRLIVFSSVLQELLG